MSHLSAFRPLLQGTRTPFISTAFCILMLCALASAQAQSPISVQFDVVELREEFSAQNDNWPYLTTMENLYVMDKDEYFMHRRNKNAAYAILTNWKNNLSVFNILTALKLGPATDENQTIGVIFLVQDDGKGAIVFEFNKFKQYRIKQLVGSYYKFLSGEVESNGWVKSSALSGKNEYNTIDIRVQLPQVDIYVNGKFLQSFDVMDYKPGGMGFLIAPDTKAKADYFYVYTTSEAKEQAAAEEKQESDNRSAVEQLAKLRYELEQQKRTLKECEMERTRAVTVLEEQVGELRAANERLSLQNRQLQAFKDQVLVEIDEDVFLTLAENLKTEILNNQRLEAQLQVYQDSLKYTHDRYNKLKLALLDRSIKKAEKAKTERDKQDALQTKKEIEQELQDKKLSAEQEEWEKQHPDAEALIEEALEKKDTGKIDQQKQNTQQKPTSASSTEVSAQQKEARPLPQKVRKAYKKQN